MINCYQICKDILNSETKTADVIKTLKSIGLYSYYNNDFILCDAMQYDPGLFVDRELILNNSEKIIAGILILAICISAKTGYICLKYRCTELIVALEQAILLAYQHKLLGNNILNTKYHFDLYIIYENNLAIQNVCDVESVVNIIDFLRSGNTESLNYRLFSISGQVNTPGVYQLPLSSSFADLLSCAGGIKNNKKLQAVISGGYNTIIAAETAMKASLDNILFNSGFIVIDETTRMVEVLLIIMKFYVHNSCKQHIPCKEAMVWIYKIVNKMHNNIATTEDLQIIQHIINNIISDNICLFSYKVSNLVKSFFHYFKPDFNFKPEFIEQTLW